LRRARRLLAANTFVNPDIGQLENALDADIFALSMPKCATSAIQRGFDKAGRPALHAHNDVTFYDAFPNGSILRDAGIGLREIVQLRLLANPRTFWIFFGYREPVSWYLSLAGHFSLPLDDTLADNFRNNLERGYPWARYRIEDTAKVILEATGLDPASATFEPRKGYAVLERANV
jgi:hypothetical protein